MLKAGRYRTGVQSKIQNLKSKMSLLRSIAPIPPALTSYLLPPTSRSPFPSVRPPHAEVVVFGRFIL